MVENTLGRHKAFWIRQDTDRPLLGCNIGSFVSQQFPRTMQSIPAGIIGPEDISVDLFLEDCEQLYQDYLEIGDDYPFVGVPFYGIPWLEAIMGCPVVASSTSFWAEPCIENWDTWPWPRPTLKNPWAQKLLELTRALVKQAEGRYPVAPTLMRGPSDMLAAMRGTAKLPLDFIDFPEVMKRAAGLCTDIWIEIGKAQLALISDSGEGYMAGHAFRTWAPEKIIWFQEDAMAVLSPDLYREFLIPLNRRIGNEFPCTGFHLHCTALWVVDQLVQVPEIDVLELDLETQDENSVEETFCAGKKILANKPLIWMLSYDDDFGNLLERTLAGFPWEGLSIQVGVKDVEEGKKVKAEFLKAVSRGAVEKGE